LNSTFIRSEVFAAVILKIWVWRDVSCCDIWYIYRLHKGSQCLQNVRKYLPSDMVSRPTWLESEVSFPKLFKPNHSLSLDANPTWLMLGTLCLTMRETWTLKRVSTSDVTEAYTSRIKSSYMLFIIKTTYNNVLS
jgi:hypothetical protein